MSGAAIQAEVAAGLAEAARETGSGQRITLSRPATRYEPGEVVGASETFPVWLVDLGLRDRYIPGTGETRRAHTVLIEAGVVTPQKGDRLAIGGLSYRVTEVDTVSPGGVALLHECEVAT
jgi:hypothetical protein